MCCEWHALSLVVVNDLYVVGVALSEDKANAPPGVQPNPPATKQVRARFAFPGFSNLLLSCILIGFVLPIAGNASSPFLPECVSAHLVLTPNI